MLSKYLTTLLGLTSVIAFNPVLPVQAEPQVYLEVEGKESLELNTNTLAILENIGLTLSDVESTATPAPGFSIGSVLLPPNSDPNVRGTTYTFLYDDDPVLYVTLGGTEEFLGTFTFEVDTTKLNGLGTQFTIGNFSNSFDEDFNFFVTDTANTGLQVFDVASSGIPNIDLNTLTFVLEGIELFFSQEFSDLLVNAGATQSVAGLKFIDGRADRSLMLVSASTPEPSSILALILLAGSGIVSRIRQHQKKS
jgi:hypothetical protein